MKKILKILIYVVVFFLLYILEISFFDGFRIAGIKPNLFLIFIVIISLYMEPNKAFVVGVLCGTYLDLLNSKAIGLTAICLGLLAYGVSSVKKMFSIESKLSLIIFIVIGTSVYELINYTIQTMISGAYFHLMFILKIIIAEALYHTLLTIIFYPLCKKILKIATEDVQQNNMERYLTRMR